MHKLSFAGNPAGWLQGGSLSACEVDFLVGVANGGAVRNRSRSVPRCRERARCDSHEAVGDEVRIALYLCCVLFVCVSFC